MSDIDLDAIRARAQAATPGPWGRHDFGHAGEQEPSSIVVHTGRFDWNDLNDLEGQSAVAWMPAWDSRESANAEFIAHARTDVVALLDEVERLRGEVDTANRNSEHWFENRKTWVAECDRLRAAVDAVRALADRMAAVPDYTATEYDQGRVDQRHQDETDIRAALDGQ